MSKPDPRSTSVSEAARWIGVRRQTLTEWLIALGIDYSEGVSVPEIFKAKIEHEKEAAVRKALAQVGVGEDGEGSGQISKEEAQRRKAVADAIIREIDMDERIGKVVPIEAVVDRVAAQYSSAREKFFAIPTGLSQEVANLDDPQVISALIRDKIDEALEELDAEAAGRVS
ncbi:hypothetical protein [Rhodovulum sp. 12E13]|uniref:hypothetical protein n=1 Tax=Rhodovulum sp. 12E13 TaxID=2203891 RepID=UPI0011C0299C|nr:hypothetical protein [Rhodovulum sp. 12E13]